MKVRLKQLSFVLACVLAFYVGSYLYLSVHGRYEPILTDINRIEAYGWAPEGFFQRGLLRGGKPIQREKWNATLIHAYMPLWFADIWYWHKGILFGVKPEYFEDKGFDSE